MITGKTCRVAWPVGVGDETKLVHTVESRENMVCDRVGTIFSSQRPAATSQAPPPEDSTKHPHKLGDGTFKT